MRSTARCSTSKPSAAAQPAYALAGLPAPQPLVTAYTISLASPEAMAEATAQAAARPLLKVKLGGRGDPARIAAVRRAAPAAELIVDANEAWEPARSRWQTSPPAPTPA